MRGHITRRGDAWRIHIYVGLDADTGKRRYVTRTVRGSRREAETVCAALVADASRGRFGDRSSGTVGELLEQWMAHIEADAAPSTMAGYRVYLRNWILPHLGEKKLDRLGPADLDRFYALLRKHMKPASVHKVHAILRAALGQAVRWRMITENPASFASPPRIRRPPINPPSPEDVAVLLAAADERDPDLGMFVRMAAVTGARRGELCALRWSDLDLERGEVVISRSLTHGTNELVEKSTKTHRSRRIALDGGTVEALARHRRRAEQRAATCETTLAADPYLFARDIEGREPWRPDSGATSRFASLRRRVGLDTVRLHDLRHYVATRLLDGGLPVRAVSERLGHSNATTTLSIYAHAVPATDRRAADMMGDLLDGPGRGSEGKPGAGRVPTEPA
ncbi:MAG TPA: site-specific integrase [Acidimicrobiia bacterium]|nr:site-specific integrase [Acidimicrobiia bacterium]